MDKIIQQTLTKFLNPFETCGSSRTFHYNNLQHSPMDDHSQRICLIKTLPRRKPSGKESMEKEKEYSTLVFL